MPSWYTEGSLVLDLDGNPQPVVARTDTSEMAVTIRADGFSYTRPGEDSMPEYKLGEYKLGNQLRRYVSLHSLNDRPPPRSLSEERSDESKRRNLTHKEDGCFPPKRSPPSRTSWPRPVVPAPLCRASPRATRMRRSRTHTPSRASWRDKNIAAGRRLVGRKIGLTSKAMQQATGITEPDYGVMFDDTVWQNGATIPFDDFSNVRIEVELAFVLKAPSRDRTARCSMCCARPSTSRPRSRC